MATLRVFVSSTCYDLSAIRGQLRSTILSMGYEPIMSDYNDVLYDHRLHTHSSCIEEVANCDLMILIVGSRYGGKAIPEAIQHIDFENVLNKSKSVASINNKKNLSITQLEVLKAIEIEIPIFSFIDSRLWNDHALYEKNKTKDILKDIEFPSIDKQETAGFIFDFINFLRHRTRGNSINQFSKFEEIEGTLKKQWSGLLQRLLHENRTRQQEQNRIDKINVQLDDLKAAMLSSIEGPNQREVATAVVRYRKLVDFLRGLKLTSYDPILKDGVNWEELLKLAGIVNIYSLENRSRFTYPRTQTLLIKNDDTYYELRFSTEWLSDISLEYGTFINMSSERRSIVFEALNDLKSNMMIIRYKNSNYRDFLDNYQNSLNKKEADEESEIDESE